MPVYEYSCKRCGDFEITQRISEDPLKKCPTCGTKVTKLISTSAFHLKGSGWYMTDYGKSGASKSPDGDTGTSGKTTDTKEGSSANATAEGTSKEHTSKTDSSTSSATKESSAST